jgi:prepilin-type N-terminal cleavage/methylation domain-containing protein
MKKLVSQEGGFTLVELLVTIAILGVLFGIVTLTLGGLTTDATANSCDAELAVVQSAVDIYMAVTMTAVVPAFGPAVIDTGDTAWGDAYLRSMPTMGVYTVATDGTITPGACPAP